ncbi:hypothetical protein Q2941_43455 [Bradyrhizobium sp. UFLA05-153]
MATKNTDIHELTRAEIARQQAVLVDRRRDIVNERARLYADMRKSVAQPPIREDELAARSHAKRLLNGNAPSELDPPVSSFSIDQQLYIEQRGIDIALGILSDKDLAARAVAAVEWAETNRDNWRELCREIVLTANKLEALRQKATDLIESCPDIAAVSAASLPGSGLIERLSLPETRELNEAAFSAGILTASDIKRAKAR